MGMRAIQVSPRPEDPMTLPLTSTSRPYAQPAEFPAIDRMTIEGRTALLGLAWAAWYSSRPEAARRLLAETGSSDPEASLKLLRLRRVAAGDPDVTALVDGLLAGTPVLHVPARLRRVMEATDADRRVMLERARVDLALLSREDAAGIAAVIGYLVGTEVDYTSADIREAPMARGYTRSVLQALGLPVDAYMPRLRSWL
jgi:hypothetical protein